MQVETSEIRIAKLKVIYRKYFSHVGRPFSQVKIYKCPQFVAFFYFFTFDKRQQTPESSYKCHEFSKASTIADKVHKCKISLPCSRLFQNTCHNAQQISSYFQLFDVSYTWKPRTYLFTAQYTTYSQHFKQFTRQKPQILNLKN